MSSVTLSQPQSGTVTLLQPQGRGVVAQPTTAFGKTAAPLIAGGVAIDSPQAIEVEVIDRGPKGDPGGSILPTAVAGVTISGLRVVTPQADGSLIYADATDVSFSSRALFLATTSAQAGGGVSIVDEGEVVEPSWSWMPGQAVFLGAGGALTQTPPSAPAFAFLIAVGYATSPTSLQFAPRSPIVLAP